MTYNLQVEGTSVSAFAQCILVGLALAAFDVPASAAATGAEQFSGLRNVNAIAAGADPTGERDSAPEFASAVAPGGVSLHIPCGAYQLRSNVPLPSHTEVVGEGDCTRLIIAPQMLANPLFAKVLPSNTNVRSVFSNADFVHGNSEIAIRNLRVLAPIPLVSGFYHAFSFYRASQITIDKTIVEGRGTIHDGNHSVFIASSNFVVTNNRHVGGGGEGSFDIWDGSENFVVSNYYCDGGGKIQRCITVNGISSGNAKANLHYITKETKNGIIQNSVIKKVKNAGFMIVGLYAQGPPAVYGMVENIEVKNNVIEGVSQFHGIWIGEAENVSVSGNAIKDAEGSCIYVGSGGPHGKTNHVELAANRCVNSGKQGSIVVGNGTDAPDHLVLSGNEISYTSETAPYSYDIIVRRNATDVRFTAGAMMKGRIGINAGVESN